MYIHRIILRDVRNFKHLDLTFYDTWTQQPLKSVLLTGPNGSGKTTLLRVIVALWERFDYWIQSAFLPWNLRSDRATPRILQGIQFAAIEIRDFVGNILWLVETQETRGEYWDSFTKIVAPENPVIATRQSHPEEYFEAGFQKPSDEWYRNLYQQREALYAGASSIAQLPNMVFLDTESRILNEATPTPAYTETPYKWLATYDGQTQGENHIENMLKNLKLRNPEQFNQTISVINSFLGNKKITDFDNRLRLPVQVNGSYHYLEDLSAGEKQCLIMMFMVSRWLMPGGVVLIDEPDLHLHVSLQRHFIHELEKVVLEKGGQLIVTSHSPTLWEEYNERQRMNLGEQLIHEQTDRLE